MIYVDEALIVRRWRRYGADRLYVTGDSGARLGCVDLQSGEVIVDEPLAEDGVRRAVQAYLRADVTELVLPLTIDRLSGTLDPLDEHALLGGDLEIDLYGGRRERGGSVRSRLDRLGDEGWQVVHNVPLGRQGTVVEHLMLGPGGIFTVTERAGPGNRTRVDRRTITIDGKPASYLRDSRLEAARVQGLLRSAVGSQLSVRAVLVLQGILEMAPDARPEDVIVVARHEVPGIFRNLPERLEAPRVDAIAAIARQRTTWSR
jgi:hypothetical protein